MAFAAVVVAASAGLSAKQIKESPYAFVQYALLALTLAIFSQLVWLNHHVSRTSSSLVLLFFPLYILVSAIRVRTQIITGSLSLDLSHTLQGRIVLAREALWFSSVGIALVAYILELYSPEKHWGVWTAPWSRGKIRLEEDEEEDNFDSAGPFKEDNEVESPVATANIYERWVT